MFKSSRGRLAKAALPLASLALALTAGLTAQAAGVGAGVGVVDGNVTLSPGFALPPSTQAVVPGVQNFVFNSVTILGYFGGANVSTGSPTAAAGACVASVSAVGVTGQSLSVGENVAGGAGVVNNFGAAGSCLVGANATVNPTGTGSCSGGVTASLGGDYVRVGALVAVALTGGATVCGVAANVATAGVVAAFVNTDPPGTNPLTHFAFAGPFVIAGVNTSL